jgi:glycosyltransferase involved in cell wall biosynthesis
MEKKPLRVLHVIGSMNRGGAEVMIMNLYRNIDREKIQFDFVENSYDEAEFDEEIRALGGKIYRCPHYNGKNHLKYKKWWKEFFKTHYGEYKVIHGHLGSTAAIYLKLAKKNNIFTIAHSHNTSGKGLKDLIYKFYSYPTRHVADYFLGCSMDAGISRYGKKVAYNKSIFSVLNNAIDAESFEYNKEIREQVREKYDLRDKFVIGHIGRFVEQKNHEFLIDIFEQIYRVEKRAFLILVGDGEKHQKIKEKINKKGIENAVLFAGVQTNVAQYYQAMDVFLLPSLFEGLGIVAVEAQCSGLPCVISNKVSRECIVTEGQVEICNLDEEAKAWAEVILKKKDYLRSDSSEQIKEHGYDILKTSKWLTDFYLEVASE